MSKRYVCGMGFTSEDKPIRIIHDKVEDKDYYLFADLCKIMNEQQATISRLEEENEQLQKKLECCEYKHFKKEQDKIYQKVKKGDLTDFGTLTISDKGLEHWNGVI